MAAHYLTRKGDHDDLDDKTTAKPFAEMVSHGNMFYPDPEGNTRQNNHIGLGTIPFSRFIFMSESADFLHIKGI